MQNDLFTVLDTVESTNNYAIEKIKQGFGIDGKAWFAKEQWGGKGQRGKSWLSEPNQNIILSIVVKPNALFFENPFYFSAQVASVCRNFIAELGINQTKIKWPNDLYINDRKAGGILIENIYSGIKWEWAIIGIGINVNQREFEIDTNDITSITNETKIVYDIIQLASNLHQAIICSLININETNFSEGLNLLNDNLYKKSETVIFKQKDKILPAKINFVNEKGQLVVKTNETLFFNIGDVVWLKTK